MPRPEPNYAQQAQIYRDEIAALRLQVEVLKEYVTEVSRLKDENASLKDAFESLRSEHHKLQITVKDAQEKVTTLDSELAKLKARTKTASVVTDELRTLLRDFEVAYKQLVLRYTELNKSLMT